MGNPFLALVHGLQYLVEFKQIGDFFRIMFLLFYKLCHIQSHQKDSRHDSHKYQRKFCKTFHYGNIDIIIINHGADHQESVSDDGRSVGADFLHSGRSRLCPPVRIIFKHPFLALFLAFHHLIQA